MAVPWWNECTSKKAPRCVWSYGLTGSSIEIQGGPLARAGTTTRALTSAARARLRIRFRMATSRYGLPVGCRSGEEGLRRREPVHAAVPREHVQLARGILPEREHVAKVDVEGPIGPARHGAAGVGEAADPSRAEVGVEILADQPGRAGAAVHQPTDDRAAIRVRVLERRAHAQERAPARWLVAVRALPGRPPVVEAALMRGLHVHFLPQVLPHVGGVQQAGWHIEGEEIGRAHV